MKRRVLIIKMSALGDLFMALPHVDVILDHHPRDDVWLLTGPSFAELFAHHPRLKIAVLDRKGWIDPESTLGRIRWVRRKHFSVIYDLQGNRTSRLLVRFGRAESAIGTQPKSIYHTHPAHPYTRKSRLNVFDRLNETLISAGLPSAEPGCALYPGPVDLKRIADWKMRHRLGKRDYAVIHAGCSSAWVSKRWPKERYLELAEKIENQGIRCIWIGGKADGRVNRYLSATVGIDATEQFNLLQLYLLGSDARFAVTNDSGPMHVLSACGIPVFSFFGPTSWIRSHAAGQQGRVLIAESDCSPCFLGECPSERQHICLTSITVETVFDRIGGEIALR